LVDFVELNAPPRNCAPEDDPVEEFDVEGNEAPIASDIAVAIGEDGAADVRVPLANCVVPGMAGFSAADASIATTPSRSDDATRRVRSWPIRLDDVRLDDLKIDNLPMRQIWQFTSKTEPTETQLQPNSVLRSLFWK
jgi:hypothetical protein